MKNDNQINTSQLAFFAIQFTGFAVALASVNGSYRYFMLETSNNYIMSGAGSLVLGIVIVCSLYVAFNHKQLGRIVAASILAIATILLSGWTIYQGNLAPTQEIAKTDLIKKQQQRLKQVTREIALIENQQATLKNQIDSLIDQNKSDTTRIETLRKKVDSNIKPKGNGLKITKLQESIQSRNKSIDKKQEELTRLGRSLPTKTDDITKHQNPKNSLTFADFPAIARAYIYDVMTAILLLLASWFRSESQHKKATVINDIKNAAAYADQKIKTLNESVAHANKLIAHASDLPAHASDLPAHAGKPSAHLPAHADAGAGAGAGADENPDKTDLKNMEFKVAMQRLRDKRIQASRDGNHTVDSLMNETKMGKPNCKKLQIKAWEEGIFSRTKKGLGYLYKYADEQQNVIQFALLKEKQA